MSFSRFDVHTLLLTIIDILHKQIFMTFLNVVTKIYFIFSISLKKHMPQLFDDYRSLLSVIWSCSPRGKRNVFSVLIRTLEVD